MNKETAVANANLNRIDQYGPYGSTTYSQVGTNDDGTPKYRQDTNLSSAEQQKLDWGNQAEIALAKLAGENVDRVGAVQAKDYNFNGMMPRVYQIGKAGLPGLETDVNGDPIQKKLDYSSLGPMATADQFSGGAQQVANAVYGQATSRLDPQWQQTEEDTRARLAAQGISENSDAYRRELDNMGRAKSDAYNQANYSAIKAGGDEQSRIFGLAMGARQQGQGEIDSQGAFANTAQGQGYDQNLSSAGFTNQARGQDINERATFAEFQNKQRENQISESTYLRNLPINDIAALLGASGGVTSPTFSQAPQVSVAPTDYSSLVTNNYNARMNAYNTQQQARSSMMGSIFGGLGSIGGAVAMSDMRFKEAIRPVGRLLNGLTTYAFRYVGETLQRFGVMAQEVLGVVPEAVVTGPDGYMRVDYSKVY